MTSRARTVSVFGFFLSVCAAATALAQGPPQIVWTTDGHTSAVEAVAFSPDGFAVASGADQPDASAAVWRSSDGSPLRSFLPQDRGVRDVAFSPDGSRLAIGFLRFDGYVFTGRVNLWDLASNTLVRTFVGGAKLAFSPDGQFLAVDGGGPNGYVSVWRVSDGQRVFNVLHGGNTTDVAYSPDGRIVASCGTDNTIKLWDAASGALLRTLSGHADDVNTIAFSPDGQWIASGAGGSDVPGESTIKLWRVSDGFLLRTLAGHADFVDDVDFSPDGAVLVSSGQDGGSPTGATIRFWQVSDGSLLATYDQQTNGGVPSVAYSPDGRTFVYGRGDGVITLAVAPNGSGTGGDPCSATISPTSARFRAAGGTGTIAVTTGASCTWSARSNASWIALPTSGATGSASVTYTVARNSTAQPRAGTITIAGQTFTVTQTRR
ncbi:MAG: PD40 domain-containing protein [Planctomycetes bacterium]|nr:PD40 domain-containing protein [Planctomycetota bacterium]